MTCRIYFCQVMWLLYTFLTAFFTSCLDVISKKTAEKVDPLVIAWSWHFFSLPFLLPFLFGAKFPTLGPQFWIALLVSGSLMWMATLFYVQALKSSDLSITVPMLAFTPIFLLVTSPLMLGEFPHFKGLIGIILIVVGSYILNFKEYKKGWLFPFQALIRERGPQLMLIVAFFYSIGANLDKVGVRNSSPFAWTIAIISVNTIIFSLIMLIRAKNALTQVRQEFKLLVLNGFCFAFVVIFNMLAINLALVPYVIAIKRISVFMTSLFGFLIFKEKGIKERLLGAILMIGGVILIALS